MTIKIRQGSISEVVALSHLIQEFFENYPENVYEERLMDEPHLILIATEDGIPVGFKVGYRRFGKDIFYSWVGGVLDQYRRNGIATLLADEQEIWAKSNGFVKVIFKTRNRFTNMVNFGQNRGFKITDLIKKGEVNDHRIVMEKIL